MLTYPRYITLANHFVLDDPEPIAVEVVVLNDRDQVCAQFDSGVI